MAFIELTNVSKKIKKRMVLNTINLSIEKGSINTFKGINGSGKTMLLRAILGLILPNKGTVTIAGTTLRPEGTFPVFAGALIEKPAFVPEFTAKRNLQLLSALTGTSEEEIDSLLLRLNISPEDTRKAKNFSLGMQQKIGIAMAFLGEPELIILDEPTNALDTNSLSNLVTLIHEYNAKGSTILIASHDSIFLENFTENNYFMENGVLERGDRS